MQKTIIFSHSSQIIEIQRQKTLRLPSNQPPLVTPDWTQKKGIYI